MDQPAILGRKQNEKALEPVYFKVSGRLTRLLGSDSVSDRLVAINELVKNGYDADATGATINFENVRAGSPAITLKDNGSGMEYYELENCWMMIGTDSKVRDPFSKKYKRRKIGQKGLGRFALQNLARTAEIISYPANQDTGHRIVFSWADYESGNVLVTGVPNHSYSFPKPKSKHGFEVRLHDLRHAWDENAIRELSRNLSTIVPPNSSKGRFAVNLEAPEFPRYSGKLKTGIFKQAIFTFKGSLQRNGQIRYVLASPKGTKTYNETLREFTCGPVEFIFYFYYRDKERMAESGKPVTDMDALISTLDEFGGIKLYRDNVRVTGFGEGGSDWLDLNALRINDTLIPSNNQLIGFVKISAENNPLIVDTTTREGIIGGKPFEDLKSFIRASIKFFSERRAELEGKRKGKRTRTKREIKKIKDSLSGRKEPEKLIDFRPRYPEVFYKPLEEEINSSFTKSLPNAALMLSRKLVENLLFNILEYKFPSDANLWYVPGQRRPQDFSILVDNLGQKKKKFPQDQEVIIDKLLSLMGTFRLEANSKSHKILEYLDSTEELNRLKIPEIIELELKLVEKIRGTGAV